MGTDTRAGALLGGASAALAWSNSKVGLRKSRLFSLSVLAAIAVIILSIYALARPESSLLKELAWPTTAFAASVIMVYLVDRPMSFLSRLLARRTIRYLGKRSYGLYLWHYVWLTWFRDMGFSGIVFGLTMSLISAELSWRLVEKPTYGWRARSMQEIN